MEKILGLDLGTNSIGWAIREINIQPNQIIAKGVLTFKKGVATTKSGEEPAVKKRTESRGRRRNYQAEKYRKWKLLETLICCEPSMCPLTIDELNAWRKYRKNEKQHYPSSRKFKDWLKLDFNGDGVVDFDNPYHLRKEVTEKVFNNPMIVGRAFYHLVQRRGFRGRDEIESKTIIEGSPDLGIVGADEIHKVMEGKDTTLGGALYYENKEGKRIRKRYNVRTDFENELKMICKIQGIDETSELFKSLYQTIIWQRPLRSQRGNIGRCTFEPSKQRCPISHPLYEDYRAWCFINNIKAKRIDQLDTEFIFLSNDQRNSIYEKLFRCKSKSFDFLDIIKILDPSNSLIFNFEKNATNKHLDVTELIKQRKNKSTPYITVSGSPVSATLMDIFNCRLEKINISHTPNINRNNKKDYYDYEDIWHVLFSFESKENLEFFAKEQLKLDEEKTKKFLGIKLQQGYSSLSINALKKILVHLHKGFIYTEAVFLANLEKVFGRELNDDETETIVEGFRSQFNKHKKVKDEISIINSLIGEYLNRPYEKQIGNYPGYQLIKDDYYAVDNKLIEFYGDKTWNKLPDDNKNSIREIITREYHNFLQTPRRIDKNLIYKTVPRLDDLIKDYLKNTWEIPEDRIKKYLYHPSDVENYPPAKEKEGKEYLGDPMPISRGFKNPMAMKTLHHLKKLINYLIEKEKIDKQTKIVIEIARELNDANRRKAIFFWQKNREEENKKYREEIISAAKDAKVEIDADNIENIYKYRLWVEQNYQCFYTGKSITFSDLFNGNEVEIEHTIPASISFDNELSNMTVCYKKYNNEIKQKQIPTACPNYDGNITIELSDGVWECGPIKERIKVWEEKVARLKKNIESNKKPNPSLSKENKDNIIVKRRMWEMDLEYWSKKVNTFTITEYKTAWRNSQLRDTQVITKYAVPYLKTVFDKVDVQKGIITAEFRKIFNVGFEKDRNKHTHHATDAAILTLIPYATVRDKLLKEYFTAAEQDRKFHTVPLHWNDFQPNHLLSLEKEILVNHLSQNRTLTPTKKYVRKRGKIQYVKEKLETGKWVYKHDESGKKIPIIAQGDSIRGQLHEESFLGAIKEFEKDGSEKLTFVKKILLKDFDCVEDFEKIVDKTVRTIITIEIEKRIENGKSFKEAMQESIWMVDENGNPKKIDKKGNQIAPIRHVRCKVTVGRGFLTRDKALEIKEHAMLSKHDHKQFVYAKNDEMSICLLYEGLANNKSERAFRLIGLFEIAQYKLKQVTDIANNSEYQFCEVGRGKNKTLIPLSKVITVGIRVLIYQDSPDELRELNKSEIVKRLYKVFKFNNAGADIIYLQHHSEARKDEELNKLQETRIDVNKYQPRLKLVANNFNCLVETKDFTITLDGEIVFR